MIEPRCNVAAKGLAAVACVLSLLFAACGGGGRAVVCGDLVCDPAETATGCSQDCGCGNNVANPGEECDGPDLGGGTCMDAVQRGGTLRCNADCTYDVAECTLASCGNGVAEDGEACDGADLGGGSCSSIGYVSGDITCSVDCAYDTSACCTDTCPTAGTAECVGNSLRECTASATGCLAWQVTDCGANNDVCDSSGEVAACVCVDRCTAGDQRCEGATIETCTEIGGCLGWVQTTDCATDGKICAAPPSGPTCALDVTAENCTDPYPLALGENIVAWKAFAADYLTTEPSCTTSALAGPDLVLQYTATQKGLLQLALNKPDNTRQVVIASSAACGTVTPELACTSDISSTTMSTELAVDMGVTYYFYVSDQSGAGPLDNPLVATVDETPCSSINSAASNLSPANGVSIQDLTPIISTDFNYPIDPTAGVITVTGTLGTHLTYDLAMGPSEIAIINGGKTLVIDPGMVFPTGETLTVSWSGVNDSICAAPIAPPTWSFQVVGAPCSPGMDGLVGDSITRIATGISSITEYYVAADAAPNGYVYVGGTSNLYRTVKTSGTSEDVGLAAGLTTSNLGYGMLIAGNEIYTLESSTTLATDVLWRISTDGGTSWTKENYAQFPQTPNDDLRAITYYKGRIYMATSNFTDTEIWSVPAGATTLPQTAVLEATITDEYYCGGIALDDAYFYLACSTGDRLIRVDRTTQAIELVTDAVDINSTKDAIQAHDVDGDGLADALYVSSYYEEVNYVCKPSGAGPFYVGLLANFGSGSTNYGLAFDRTNNVLWMFDDDTKEFVKIE